MRAGELTQRITLQAQLTSRNSERGSVETSWSTVASDVAAKVEPLSGREYFDADRVQSEITHRVTIHFRRGVRSDWRVLLGNRVLRIIAPVIDVNEQHVWLEMMCREDGLGQG